jgi:hypothetical protein
MPNFELSETHKYDFRNACASLCSIRTETIEQDFPLSQKDIEQGMIPSEMRTMFNRLRDMGVESLRLTNSPAIFFGGEGIDRPAAVYITGIQRTWYAYEAQDSNSTAQGAIKSGKLDKKYFFDNAVLQPEIYARLVRWVNAAVREHRQSLLTCTIVNQFINFGAHKTMGHVIARWPALTLVFDQMDRTGSRNSRSNHSWRDRINQLPKTKDRWGWPVARYTEKSKEQLWYEKNQKLMAVCDEMLVGAATMTRPTGGVGIKARVLDWRRKEGEKI